MSIMLLIFKIRPITLFVFVYRISPTKLILCEFLKKPQNITEPAYTKAIVKKGSTYTREY